MTVARLPTPFSGATNARKLLALNVRYLRHRQGLGFREFCRRAGIAENTLYRVESGLHSTGLDILEMLALTLKVPLWRLFKDVK